MSKKEIWKIAIVDGVENPKYQVSNLGRVKNMDFYGTGKPRLCRLSKHSDGYLTVTIECVPKLVHRIVAETFIPNPEGKPCVDHIDTNRQRNVIEVDENGVPVEKSTLTNLRWATYEENYNNPLSLKHYSKNYTMLGKFGAEHNRSIAIVQLDLNGKFIKKWSCAADVERELGIDHSGIAACCKGKQKQTGGFRWMYYYDWFKTRRKKSLKDIKPLFV